MTREYEIFRSLENPAATGRAGSDAGRAPTRREGLNVTSTVDHLLQQFVKMLPKDRRIEHVYGEPEDDVLKISTVIPEPDCDLEGLIYDAQVACIDTFPTYEFDFSVIYRFGKALSEVAPTVTRMRCAECGGTDLDRRRCPICDVGVCRVCFRIWHEDCRARLRAKLFSALRVLRGKSG